MRNKSTDKTNIKVKRTYYQNGKKKSETRLSNRVEHGVCRVWYPNGEIKDERNYHYGTMNGYWREWHQNGQLSWESYQVNGKTLNGSDRGWDENGNLVYNCDYKDGNLHGKYYKRSDDGTETTEYWWQNKKLKYSPEHAALMIDFLSNLGYEIKPLAKNDHVVKLSLV